MIIQLLLFSIWISYNDKEGCASVINEPYSPMYFSINWHDVHFLKFFFSQQTLYKNSREALDFEALASDSADRTDEDDGSKKSGGSGSSTPVKPPTGVGSTSSGSPSASSPNKRSTEKNKNKVP